MDYLPLSYLNHLAYCLRRFWYMYVQGELAVNAPMLEGSLLHERADRTGYETDDRGRLVQRRVWVWSERLQIAGFADFVEQDGTTLLPVEYKHGQKGKWDNDEIQLCAQALCLEEMTGQPVPQGEIFYWRSRRRVTVVFDARLRRQTETAVSHAHHLLTTNRIPAPIQERHKCKHCSLQPICLPDEVAQLQVPRSL
ncbi:MAG: CRISPR-associated protein Cas4 [Anaerolineales bacterium]|nr:CRISPR-associated protein Cas4 [Anaerolineales bacterium]